MKKCVVILISPILMFFLLLFAPRIYANEQLTPIMGHGKLSVAEMAEYLFANNDKNGLNPITKEYAYSFAEATVKYAGEEGVDHDIAFSLMMHETGYLNFGGDVQPQQNNFGGLGSVGGGAQGASFASMEEGILAVVQHLKCYASQEPLNLPCVDPRFSEGLRRKAAYAEYLGYGDNPHGTGWAYPGEGYGNRLISLIGKISESTLDADIPPASTDGNTETQPPADQTEPRAAPEINISDVSIVVLTLILIILLKFLLTKNDEKTTLSQKRKIQAARKKLSRKKS